MGDDVPIESWAQCLNDHVVALTVRRLPLAAMTKLARSMLLVCRSCYRHDAPVDRTPYVSVYKFLKQGLDISVMWDNDSDDPIITLIGGCYNHMKEVIEIVNGTDKDDEDDN